MDDKRPNYTPPIIGNVSNVFTLWAPFLLSVLIVRPDDLAVSALLMEFVETSHTPIFDRYKAHQSYIGWEKENFRIIGQARLHAST